MLLMYDYVLLKMSTWYSKHVEESNNIWRINNFQCMTLVVLYGLPIFYKIRRLITAFKSARQLSLSWASSNQSIPQIPLPEDPSYKISCPFFVALVAPKYQSGPRLSLWLFRNVIRFYGEELLAPSRKPKLEGHLMLAVRDCLFNIRFVFVFVAVLHIGGRSSICILRTLYAVVRGTYLSQPCHVFLKHNSL